MEVKIDKKGILKITHQLRKDELYKVHEGKRYNSVNIYSHPQVCSGFSSRTEDNMDVLLLDYDSVEESVILADIELIQDLFNLPSAYIFYTDLKKEGDEYIGNYHVIFISKHTPKEIRRIMEYTHIDANFADSPLRSKYRSWVLRMSEKKSRNRPTFLGIADAKADYYREISTAHMELLSKLYPKIKHPFYRRRDRLKKIKLQQYQTRQ